MQMIEKFKMLLDELLVSIVIICAKITSKIIKVFMFFNYLQLTSFLKRASK